MKPLIAHWCRLGASVCIFYDDGMAVAADPLYLTKLSLQMHCDLLRAGLVPGANKLLYSQPKGIKQKYILCISGLVAYTQLQ